jgi:hypothetical protein
MIFFLDLLVLLGFFATLWKLAASPIIPDWAAVTLILLFLLMVVPLRVVGRLKGGDFGSQVRRAFTVGIPLLSFLILAIGYEPLDWPGRLLLLSFLSLTFLMLVGIWLAVWGAFADPHGLFWKILPLIGIFVFVIGLVLNRLLPPKTGASLIVILAVVTGAANLIKSRQQNIGRTLTIGLVIATLFLMFVQRGWEFITPLVALGFLFLVFYWVFKQIFR